VEQVVVVTLEEVVEQVVNYTIFQVLRPEVNPFQFKAILYPSVEVEGEQVVLVLVRMELLLLHFHKPLTVVAMEEAMNLLVVLVAVVVEPQVFFLMEIQVAQAILLLNLLPELLSKVFLEEEIKMLLEVVVDLPQREIMLVVKVVLLVVPVDQLPSLVQASH
jgi:hypothetical protein